MKTFGPDSRVWGEWVPGRWYPGRIAGARGPYRFVKFDDSGEAWIDTQRIVAAPEGPDPVLMPGQRVVAEWQPGAWYPGAIDELRGNEFHVRFDDGGEGTYRATQIRLGTGEPPIADSPAGIGSRVDAQWTNGLWYPGLVAAVIGGELRIDFDDGDVSTLPVEKTRHRVPGGALVRRAQRATAPAVGATVLACSGPRSGWRSATVESVSSPLVDVRFGDDTRATITLPWVACLPDDANDPVFPPDGAAILAEWVPGHWFTGVMGRVIGSRGHVVYDDGTKAWLTPWMVAAL